MPTLILVLTCLSLLLWLWELFAVVMTGKKMARVEEMEESPLDRPPKVSIIIPACDEADTLEKSMRERLQEDYPDLEFILVDDRSRDNTREIAKKIAASDDRVKLVCIDHLPEGWLGKVHALHRGVQESSGDWLVFSDADVHVKQGALTRLIHYCLSNRLDHLAALFDFYKAPLLVDTCINVFLKALIMAGTPWRIKNPKSRAYGGAGAFSMVSRSALEQTKGLEWLKMEVVDDVSLGMMVKRSGFKCDMVHGRGFIGLHWYRSFKDMSNGMGRALFSSIGNYRSSLLVLTASTGFIMDMIAYAALIPMGIPWLPFLAAGLILLTLLVSVLTARLLGLGLLPALLLPLGNMIIFGLSLVSAVTNGIRGGISWRGTFYSKKELKKGRRIAF
jgi:hypothetical protein